NDALYGGAGDDVLDGGYGADLLEGGDGDDRLSSHYNAGGNRFRGGAGDDYQRGSYRQDTYYYRRGDGRDVIDERSGWGYTDTLVLEDLNAADVVFTREGSSLVIEVPADGGRIKVQSWYESNSHRLEQVIFADGEAWDVNALHHAGLEFHGSALDEELTGLDNQADRMYGEAGADTLVGRGGNDALYGGAGDDVLDGGYGADLLEGGDGDDRLSSHYNAGGNRFRGGAGDDYQRGSYRQDTYYYRKGDGRDVIDERSGWGYTDTLVLEDVAHDQVWFERSGNDLLVSAIGTDGRVAVADWFASSSNRIELIHAADGMALAQAAVDQLVSAMAAFSPPPVGEMQLGTALREQLNPVLASSWQPA
ncbi:MAG: calcium-binding protein, partial [Gammaproteobacteria bacterium]